MTEVELTDYSIVKKRYPEAFLKKEKTFNLRCEQYTVYDPDSARYIGPTAFSADSAWHHAAERLRREEP